ncbi:hypothetical protein ABZV93_17550 [Actinopolymorpha sp. NPDC004070]|uniref:hypothetical protein n=1 Tax=Actinopolymorpha sp. NPDC004070 TaxID=3154548 RepID=UPI0033A6A407
MSSKFLVRAATGVAAASGALLLATPGLASASVASPDHGEGRYGPDHGGSKYLKVICVNGERPMTLGRDSGDDGWAEPRSDRQDAKGSDEYDGHYKGEEHYKSEKQYKKDGKNVLVQNTTIITCGDVAVSQSAAQDHSASASAAGSISLCADRAPSVRVAQCADETSGAVTPRGPVAGGDAVTPRGPVAGGDGGASGTNSSLAVGGSGALAAAAALGTVLLRRRTSAVTAA